jgi:ABC-type nitrate/sulfonate/bicarbonate transport system permease component/ABC-type nitrate/sulfonate/bicarbonate transport system substrate-binding protein
MTMTTRRPASAAPRWAFRHGPALALSLAALGTWELAVRALRVPEYLLPAPSAVLADLLDDRRLLLDGAWVTLREMLGGIAIAVAAGLALALLLHLSATLRRALYPLLIGSQTVPVVVLAPVLVILLGFDLAPKLAIVALTCFFPIVVNGVDGLRSVDAELVRMMRTLHASRWGILRRVELPSALPPLFSGMRVAATYAAIGAVFGEWAGSNAGLGYVMLQATPSLDTPRIFAAVVLLTLLSLALFALVSLLERALVPWGRRPGALAAMTLAAAVALLAAGCGAGGAGGAGGPGGPRAVELSLDWTPNPDHASLYYAQEKGLFQRAGLAVRMRAPSDPSAPIKLVGLRKVDLAISYEPDLFFAADKGLPVVAVAALVPVPLNSLIALPGSGISAPADLKGRSVGITGIPGDDAILRTVARGGGLGPGDIRPVNVGYNLVPSLLAGKVDAILGGYRNVEGIQIAQRTGRRPVVLPVDRLGVPTYDELVLVANAARLRADAAYAGMVRRFVGAMSEGIRAAAADRPGATAAMGRSSTYPAAFLRVSVPATLELQTPPDGRPVGCLDMAAWQRYGAWMHRTGLLPHQIDATKVATTAYLPRGCG